MNGKEMKQLDSSEGSTESQHKSVIKGEVISININKDNPDLKILFNEILEANRDDRMDAVGIVFCHQVTEEEKKSWGEDSKVSFYFATGIGTSQHELIGLLERLKHRIHEKMDFEEAKLYE